jgi:protein-tyrosine-phosphatase
MAECILNREGRGKFRAFSAGSQPSGEVSPLALSLLRKTDYDVSQLRSKSWDEFAGDDAPKLDFVFTVCDDAANEICPVWPGQPMTAHWGLPDPAKATGNEAERSFAFDDCFRMLNQRISIFVNLPLDKLSKLSLQKQLDEIGKSSEVVCGGHTPPVAARSSSHPPDAINDDADAGPSPTREVKL